MFSNKIMLSKLNRPSGAVRYVADHAEGLEYSMNICAFCIIDLAKAQNEIQKTE